jgi:nucleotide-binding universal stress UspA family protein
MMSSSLTLVVGAGTCDSPDPVLQLALRSFQGAGTRLHVVHAYSYAEPISEAYAALGRSSDDVDYSYRAFVRRRLQAQVVAIRDDCDVVFHAVEGNPADVIADVAADVRADLIVVGASHAGSAARAVLGTVAAQLAREAPSPVLVLRTALARGSARTLIATDLSPLADLVVPRGCELASLLFGEGNAGVRVLLVVGSPPLLAGGSTGAAFEQIAEHELREYLDDLPVEGCDLQPVVRLGEPADEILREAADWKADLIVTGTHGRSGIKRLLLGSVAESVLNRASCNTLLLPGWMRPQRADWRGGGEAAASGATATATTAADAGETSQP